MISAVFGPGGFNRCMPCVYVIKIITQRKIWLYIGKTGTSNNTGRSAPYQRLSKHIGKIGSTHSCIWDNIKNNRLSLNDLKKATIYFYATFIQEQFVNEAEKWMIMELHDYNLLNKINGKQLKEDSITVKIKKSLKELIKSVESNDNQKRLVNENVY